jgi:hypothetical protein
MRNAERGTRNEYRALLGVLVALIAAGPAAAQGDAPAFKAAPGAALPFASLAAGAGAAPATAILTVAGLEALHETVQNPDERLQTALATSTLFLAGQGPAVPLTEIALLKSGERAGCWALVNTDLARPVPPGLLARFGNQPSRLPDPANFMEHDALAYVLLLASQNSPEAFRASAAPNRAVTYAMMFQQPHAYRGKVVHVAGEARWVKKLESPLREQGVADLYEVWIVDPLLGPRPYSVLLTELPADLQVGKLIRVPVELDGYFLKRREEPEDAVPFKAWHSSLLIAGRSLTLPKLRATPARDTAEVVQPIPAETLAKIKDGPTLPAVASEGMEFDALIDVLAQTWYTSPKAFEKAARTDLSFRQLFEHPDRYRGEVVHLEGRLRLVQPWEPPLMAREAGVPMMYEAAIFDAASGENPFIVFVMERPEGVPLDQKVNETATFDGYFYKKWRYKSLDSVKPTEGRYAPLLIGRSLKVRKGPAAPAAEPLGWTMIMGMIVVAVLTVGVAVMFVMAFWLRRGDARVQDRLHALRTGEFVPPPGGEPPAT